MGVGRQEYTFSISVINRIIYWSYGIHTYGHMNMYVYTYMVYDCICCILETMMIYFIIIYVHFFQGGARVRAGGHIPVGSPASWGVKGAR